MYTQPPTWESAAKGTNLLVVAKEVTESLPKAEQMALFPLRPLAHTEYHNPETWVTPSWQIPKAPLLHSKHAETKKYGPNERTEQSSRKNTTKQ